MNNQELTLEQAQEQINDLIEIIGNLSNKLSQKEVRIAELEVSMQKVLKATEHQTQNNTEKGE